MINLNKDWVAKKISDLRIKPSRGNGQNFLINPKPIEAIISAGNVKQGEHVLEIGPGLGALTEALLQAGARVTAIEFDPKLATYLKKNFAENKNFTVIEGGVMEIATDEFLSKMGTYKVIANIPYHLTSDIIRRFTDTKIKPETICLLVQKEVAQRLAAVPPNMSMLALFTQWFARVEYIATVPRSYFMPAPEVDSAIVRITPLSLEEQSRGLTTEEQKQLFSLIKRGFSSPRKQLGNNIDSKSETSPIDLKRRAETLTHEEWITLFRSLS